MSVIKSCLLLSLSQTFFLLGTPIQNNVHEIWATFDFLMPNFLGAESNFIKEFAKPIINGQKLEASASEMNKGMDCLKILHQQVLPFVLRREKGQVIRELPPKIITDIPCVLSSQQEFMYKQVIDRCETKAALDIVDKTISNSEHRIEHDEQQQLGSNVLASLLQLRLICTHPTLNSLLEFKKQTAMCMSTNRLDSSGKLMALNDLLRHSGLAGPEIAAADNDTSGFLVASNQLIDSDNEDDLFVDEGCIDDNTDQDVGERTPVEQSKCLIFAQFTQSLDIVEKYLFEPHMPSLEYLRLDGSVPSNQRSAIVDRFNEDASIKVLLLTTKVGGLGLNLTGKSQMPTMTCS
jgi:TATA-binding protein-associated factor